MGGGLVGRHGDGSGEPCEPTVILRGRPARRHVHEAKS